MIVFTRSATPARLYLSRVDTVLEICYSEASEKPVLAFTAYNAASQSIRRLFHSIRRRVLLQVFR